MPLETGSSVRLAVFQETVHHTAFPEVYKGEYTRGLLVSQTARRPRVYEIVVSKRA